MSHKLVRLGHQVQVPLSSWGGGVQGGRVKAMLSMKTQTEALRAKSQAT